MLDTIAAAVSFALCSPTIIAASPWGERPWVEVRNDCGASLDLGKYSARVGLFSWAESAAVDQAELAPGGCHTYFVEGAPEPGACLASIGIFDVCDDVLSDPPLVTAGVGVDGAIACAGDLDEMAEVEKGQAAYLIDGAWIGAEDVGPLPCAPHPAHCLTWIAASPGGGWAQVRNVCDFPIRGRVGADFGYCELDIGTFGGDDVAIEPGACAVLEVTSGEPVIGELCALGLRINVDGIGGDLLLIGDEGVCLDGLSVADIDAPEPWPGEALYLDSDSWSRSPDSGPSPC